ncbi:hypothetical protein FHS25_007062 [Rhizobium laguerreae]|uniref:Uncharacterized protein n=1 Tax=Rhizobium laguerreae TaxID=1076926 RepID=A0ABR6GJT8_9HYPH|nr:hypothetical protein [Rhizobium laguerreae]MBB3166545.1 hypothetical protein [Rhizobium laguerreae]
MPGMKRVGFHEGRGKPPISSKKVAAVREVWPEDRPLTARFGVIEFDGRDEDPAGRDRSCGKIQGGWPPFPRYKPRWSCETSNMRAQSRRRACAAVRIRTMPTDFSALSRFEPETRGLRTFENVISTVFAGEQIGVVVRSLGTHLEKADHLLYMMRDD